jgi:hypothetical protein
MFFPAVTVPAGENRTADSFVPIKAETAPVIDGDLSEEIWQRAPKVSGFKTYSPDFDRDMAEKTEVYYAYDRENLYFAFQSFDSQPEKIKAAVSSRDSIRQDDWICINLDSFNDHQSLYAFYVNPLGIQMDSRFAGNVEDYGFDAVWYSAGRILAEGYSVEVRIPFKSLRFSRKNPVGMGVIFERHLSRYSENGTFPPLDPKKGFAFTIQTNPLFLEDVKHYTLWEVLPGFTLAQRSSAEEPGADLVSEGSHADISLTTKLGITSHLTLDATYNPDFSQVEADAGQVDFNQRYALFYPEKRPFFLEGMDIFNFGGHAGGDYLGAVVHTRNIVDPGAGVKVSGKISDKNVIAVLYSLDELPEPESGADQAHFSIFRYKRTLGSDSFLGAFLTDREVGTGYNRVAGGDGYLRLTGASGIGFHGLASQDKSESFEPDAGHAVGADFVRSDRNSNMRVAVQDISNDFRTDVGYVTRTGVSVVSADFTPMIHTDSGIVRRIDPILQTTQVRDKPSGRYETAEDLSLRLILPRSAAIAAGYGYSTEIYLAQKFETSGWHFSGQGQPTKQISFSARYTRQQKIRYVDLPFPGKGNDAAGSFTYQPAEKLNFNVTLTYSDFFRSSDGVKEYDYTIVRSRNTYQLNRYLFFRGILEYNSFRRSLVADFLASFTYIPGTVVHFGYGSVLERPEYPDPRSVDPRYQVTARSFFFKASYLWRL